MVKGLVRVLMHDRNAVARSCAESEAIATPGLLHDFEDLGVTSPFLQFELLAESNLYLPAYLSESYLPWTIQVH